MFSFITAARGEFSHSGSSEFALGGFKASGHVIVFMEEGGGWFADQGGDRVPFEAPLILIYAPGDWVQYGSAQEQQLRLHDYWGPRERAEGYHPCDPGIDANTDSSPV